MRTYGEDGLRPQIKWMTEEHHEILNRLSYQEDSEVSIRQLKNHFRNHLPEVTPETLGEEEFRSLLEERIDKLIETDLVEQTGTSSFQITDRGIKYIEGGVDRYELFDRKPPIHVRITRFIGKRLLGVFDWLERDIQLVFKDPDDESWEEIEREFLDAFHQRSWYSLGVLLIVVGFAVDLYIFDPTFNLQVYGLLFDSAGALILVRSVVSGSKGILIGTEEFAGRWTGPSSPDLLPSVLIAQTRRTVDAIWASSLLIFGFALQIFAVWGT